MIEKVLVVDADPLSLRFFAEVLQKLGKEVHRAENGEEAIERLKEEPFDLIFTDLNLPLRSGLEVLQEARRLSTPPLVILVAEQGTVESAVEAMRKGAFHYLLKPSTLEGLKSLVQKGEEHLALVREHRFYREEQPEAPLIAESPKMKRLLKDLPKIAKSQASVFITGESGTGKEVIASAIHRLSPRASHPFVKVNCAAIPETLLESEFFGHEKGSFTGALGRKIGRFELADRGTLLLDEVTEIPLLLQPKLLRAIQELEFERVGGTRSIEVNIRFLATSNRQMQEAIESKIFREDLFYRLNVIPIQLPPLREREEDILPLAHFFLEKFCQENHKPLKSLSKRAEARLLSYRWPGNVRELSNLIERSVVLDFDQEIESDHLFLDRSFEPGPSHGAHGGSLPVGLSLHEMEKRLILATLEAHGNNKTQAASVLGISIRTLRNKLYEYENLSS